jgi:hypothetical protein
MRRDLFRMRCKLSLVVVAYNMSRELPRTVLSLSAPYQRGIESSDYEIIVVDNGSREPLDADALKRLGENIVVHRMQDASASPVGAINFGLERARGDVIGVFIDGARMASPGLLAAALDAAQTCPRPVIGTISFHLGPEVQSRSVARGYSRSVEDALLASIDWVNNGYLLFSISVFAASSVKGWLALPSETNSLFLKREHWVELGGYETGFQCPGGGLANLDMWARACESPAAKAILLLGEATFHQVHGGVSAEAEVSRWDEFHAEYLRIRGRKFVAPSMQPHLVGHHCPESLSNLDRLIDATLSSPRA